MKMIFLIGEKIILIFNSNFFNWEKNSIFSSWKDAIMISNMLVELNKRFIFILMQK